MFINKKMFLSRKHTIIISSFLIAFISFYYIDFFSINKVFASKEGDGVIVDDDNVESLLSDTEISFDDYKYLLKGDNKPVVKNKNIHFENKNTVDLIIDGVKEEYETNAFTVGQFISEINLGLTEHDSISVTSIKVIEPGMKIVIKKAKPVYLKVGSEDKKKIWTTKNTIKGFLNKEEITYDKNVDIIKPDRNEEIVDYETISVDYIDSKKKKETEKIGFDKVEKEDADLEKGKTEIKQEGENGELEKTYQVDYKNNKVTNKEKISEKVIKKPKDKIILKGTKEIEKNTEKKKDETKNEKTHSSTSNKSDKQEEENSIPDKKTQTSSNQTMTMEATAYGPDCSGCSGISATGMSLTGGEKVIAVDPSVIPLGTKVRVEGYGEAVAADTGGAIKGNKIDVLFPSEKEASNNWGRKTVEVEILK